jgi:DNA-binding FadR family transcriptional regulator
VHHPPELSPVSARQVVLAPIEDRGAVEQVARRLGEAIGAGLLAPGERLPSETELAEQLRVSVMTLREALRALRDAGLIETRRGRLGGSFVSAQRATRPRSGLTSLTELREFTDWRHAITAEAAALAARRRTAAEAEALRGTAARVADAVADAPAYRVADARFHLAVAEASRNRRLIAAEAAIQVELGEILREIPSSEHARRTSQESHAPIVGAIARGRAEAARAAAGRHIEGTYDWVVGLMLGRLPAGREH